MESYQGTPAARLWRAAIELLPPLGADAMDVVQRQLPSRRISAVHLDQLTRYFDRECESYISKAQTERLHELRNMVADPASSSWKPEVLERLKDELWELEQFWSNPPTHVAARNAIETYAEQVNVSPDHLCECWSTAGSALREVMHLENIQMPISQHRDGVAICDTCALCWATGFPSLRGKYFCNKHVPLPGNSSYKEAIDLHQWRAPKTTSYTPFLLTYRKVLAIAVGEPITLSDPVNRQVLDISYGRLTNASHIAKREVALECEWVHFPKVHKYLSEEFNFCEHDFVSAEKVLQGIDPIQSNSPFIHRVLHEAYARDQRLLIDQLVYAEAWLTTRQFISKNHGGKRKKMSVPAELRL